MANHVRDAVAREVDTDSLFEKYNIDEIREIEKRTRQDIERKKEDLRIMVGERYRELIEAADTIFEMKNSAQNVVKSITNIQDQCQDLRHTFQAKTFSSLSHKAKRDRQGKPEEHQFYNMATQIKLLMDMPEKIWSAMDAQQYLRATQLFLLARHANTGIHLGSHHAGKVHSWFPVLTRQWAAISHFKGSLLQTCRHILRDVTICDKLTAECLASIMLLEDGTPRQVFNEFLLARSSSVSQLFQSDQTTSIKTQISEVVKTLVTTIHQIYTIFYDGRDAEASVSVPCNLLMKILSEVTDKGEKGVIIQRLETSISAKHLSKALLDYRPKLQQHATAIQLNNLQDNCLQWIDTCKTSIRNGLLKLLGFITTVKGLAAIRDEVWELLKEDSKMITWDIVCQEIAKRSIKIWDDFFRTHFMDRTKALLQDHFDTTLTLCKTQIGHVLTDVGNLDDRVTASERNLANYIWLESNHDIPSHMAWVAVGAKTLQDGGGLMMKAKSYTPAVQRLCHSFDSKTKILLEDSGHYLRQTNELIPEELGPFDKYSDHVDIQEFIEAACQQSIQKLTSHLNNQLYASEKQLDSSVADPPSCKIIIDRVLLLGRLCVGLCELSPHLQQCMSSSRLDRPLLKKRPRSRYPDNPKWLEMKSSLMLFAHDAFKMWTNHMAKNLVSQFSKYLMDFSNQALLRACTKWDEIQIEEETEAGEKVQSTILIPMQMSWYVQSLLYELCEEINRIGGHAIHRVTLVNLVILLTDGVLDCYGTLLERPQDEKSRLILSQNRSLQLMFDIKALMNIFPRRDDSEENKTYQTRGRSLVDQLENNVDPFDLDVFMPHIQHHLYKQSQRSNILYGALMSIDRQTVYMPGRKSIGGQQEQHNVLPLTASTYRFPLLPLSIQSRSLSQPIIQSPKPYSKGGIALSPSHGSSSTPPPILSPKHTDEQSSSFFGQMSTIWFSNVGKN